MNKTTSRKKYPEEFKNGVIVKSGVRDLSNVLGCSGQQKTDTRVKLQADMLASRRLPG